MIRIQVALTCRVRACLDEDLKAILLVLLLWNLVLMGTLTGPQTAASLSLTGILVPSH